jgi:uroporphyrinogen decarboxylase
MDLLHDVTKISGSFELHPDFNRFVRAITTREPGPVPVGDIFADYDTVVKYLNEKAGSASKQPTGFAGETFEQLDQHIRFCIETGWDYAYCFSSIPFAGLVHHQADSSTGEELGHNRSFMKADVGPITSWDDFERYPWPEDFHAVNLDARFMARRVPEGMKVMVIPGGLFEWTTWLMGLVTFSYALADQPDLIDAVIARVSKIIYAVIEDMLDEPNIGGMFLGDDMGFNTGTFVSPAMLRRKFFPHLKQVVDLVHSAGKVFVLHTCGNVYSVMDDLIAAGIDAKNSFEDKIMPVEQVYARWGDRVALVGGVDMNLLASGEETQVRARTRQILEICGPGGHYVLGTGNSVANYLPVKNYLAMLDEGRKWNKDHFGRD